MHYHKGINFAQCWYILESWFAVFIFNYDMVGFQTVRTSWCFFYYLQLCKAVSSWFLIALILLFLGFNCCLFALSLIICSWATSPIFLQGDCCPVSENGCWWICGYHVHPHSLVLCISNSYILMHTVVSWLISLFRDDDLANTVVIDKINIFRADRVFKVFCFISYLISQFGVSKG